MLTCALTAVSIVCARPPQNQAKETLANEAAVVSETTEAEQRALDEQRKEQKLPPKSLPLELVLAPSSKPKP